jgi:hypothetical protein
MLPQVHHVLFAHFDPLLDRRLRWRAIDFLDRDELVVTRTDLDLAQFEAPDLSVRLFHEAIMAATVFQHGLKRQLQRVWPLFDEDPHLRR